MKYISYKCDPGSPCKVEVDSDLDPTQCVLVKSLPCVWEEVADPPDEIRDYSAEWMAEGAIRRAANIISAVLREG